jgi:diglucosylglycerate octanoyltransferase
VPRHVLILGDSLTYHGPEHAELPADRRLWPQVMVAQLADDGVIAEVDLVARLGWTARDGWWALTKDPRCWGEVLPRADAVVLALGGMDQLPAAIPTYLREGIAYLRPGGLRRRVRAAYRTVSPRVMRATGGPWRQLPQAATDAYLGRIVEGVRYWRPDIPIVLLGPAPYDASDYPVQTGHGPAVAAARDWAGRYEVGFIDVDPLVWPSLRDGTANPDGMHWGWSSHAGIGSAVAGALSAQWAARAQPALVLAAEESP